MRSTSRRRLALCASCALASPVQRCMPDAFAAWRLSKRFVVGGQLPSRSALRAGARALRRLISF